MESTSEGSGPTSEENLAAVTRANAHGQLVDWSRVSVACPECEQRNVLGVRQVYRLALFGTFALAGAQLKAPARIAWEYKCSACGAEGDAEPKGEADD